MFGYVHLKTCQGHSLYCPPALVLQNLLTIWGYMQLPLNHITLGVQKKLGSFPINDWLCLVLIPYVRSHGSLFLFSRFQLCWGLFHFHCRWLVKLSSWKIKKWDLTVYIRLFTWNNTVINLWAKTCPFIKISILWCKSEIAKK